jgi:alpha-beta hydrolase superfamily lysophospholipase
MTLAHQDAVVTWTEPDPVPLRGTLVLLPGRGESAQVYERFGRRIATDAYRVHVVAAPSDSPGRTRDQVLGLLDAADPRTPRIVAGSDAGAAYAAHLAARSGLPGATALILAGLPTSAAAPQARDWDGELDARTTCPTHRRRISDGGVRPAELFTDLPGGWLDPGAPAQITVPVLGVHGREDPLSPIEAARPWYAAVHTAELVSIAGGRHDVLNDQTHRTVAASIVLFLERLRAGADLAPIAVTEQIRAR